MTRSSPADADGPADTGLDEGSGLVSDGWAEEMAAALRRYREAMRSGLRANGYEPVPPAANWVLLAIARQPGSVNDLAERLGLAKQAVSRLADRLVVLGYCDRRHRESNRRTVLLSVTERGNGVAAVLRRATLTIDATVTEQLDAADLRAFERGLNLLARPIDPAPGPRPEPPRPADRGTRRAAQAGGT